MPLWSELKRRDVFKVGVAYLVLVWLLILFIAIVFPLLDVSAFWRFFVIGLLLAGFPMTLILAWNYDITPDGIKATDYSERASRFKHARRFELILLGLLLVAVVYLTTDRLVRTESTNSVQVAAPEDPDRLLGLSASSRSSNTLRIGVLSPKAVGSRSRRAGEAHEAAVRSGFLSHGELMLGNSAVNVEFIERDDRGESDLAVELALQLVNEYGVAAILGPVNSSSTNAVLDAFREEGIAVPVLSALSTAPDLTNSKRPDTIFFRFIFNDAIRMQRYAMLIEEERRQLQNQGFLFLFEDDDYGRGLRDSLSSSFWSTSNVVNMAWCDAIEIPDSSHCLQETVGANDFDRLLLPDYYDQVESGEVFSSDLLSLLDQGKINNIVLLGTNGGSLALSLGLETLGNRFEYYFVGNDADWQDRAPYGSMTVGNPVLDFENAPPTLAAEWRDVVDKWEFETGIDGSDFQITSYEAGSVLFQALQRLLHNERVLPAVDAIRLGLLDLLRNQRFDALEPYRTIDFSEYGELRTPPAAPVYRLGRGLTREDLTDLQGWVDVDVMPSFNFLESPIQVTLKENGVDSARIVLSRVEDGMPVQIRTQEIKFSGGEAETVFHVFVPGQYRVTVDGVQSSPVNAETQIVLSNAYILSAIAALLGAWIMISRERASIRKRINRIALGVFAGFVLTFSSLYGNEIAGWFPFPSFGDEPTINALLTGLVGGLVGPYVLAEAIVNWILILSVQLDGKRERQVPEGL